MQYFYIIIGLLQTAENEFGYVTTWTDTLKANLRSLLRAIKREGVLSLSTLRALCRLNIGASVLGPYLLRLIDEVWAEAETDFGTPQITDDTEDTANLALAPAVRQAVASAMNWHLRLMPEAQRYIGCYARTASTLSTFAARIITDDVWFAGWLNIKPCPIQATNFPELDNNYNFGASLGPFDSERIGYIVSAIAIDGGLITEASEVVTAQGETVDSTEFLTQFRALCNSREDSSTLPWSTPWQVIGALSLMMLKPGYSVLIEMVLAYYDALCRRYQRIIQSHTLNNID